jgi:prepilin-type N-terminal cleavage/methylation domain-containing protein
MLKQFFQKNKPEKINGKSCLFFNSHFTLIELLVTIAIIAILASMLLPALSNARKRAYDATCTSTQKTFGTYFMLYANDHDGWSIGRPDPYLHGGLSKWWRLFKKDEDVCSSITFMNNKNFKNYILCPAASATGIKAPDGHYAINAYLVKKYDRGKYAWRMETSGDTASFFKPESVKYPQRLFWLKCAEQCNIAKFSFWHGNGSLMLFTDLSVRNIKRNEIPPYNGEYREIWCYYPTSGSPKRTSY